MIRSTLDGQTPRIDLLNDVWQLTLSGKPTWSALPVEGEPPPANARLVIHDPVDDAMGWELDDQAKKRIDAILVETLKDPVGPEFMAPPSRDDSALAA